MMKKLNIQEKRSRGFTIIEVVLVLAIAGLIFLIVFLALPGLQRSRRDTQRKSDIGNLLGKIENFASNNNGVYPQTQFWDADLTLDSHCPVPTGQMDVFACQINSSTFKDPSGNDYIILGNTNTSLSGKPMGSILYQLNSQCGGTGSTHSVAVTIQLESGGNYCQGD